MICFIPWSKRSFFKLSFGSLSLTRRKKKKARITSGTRIFVFGLIHVEILNCCEATRLQASQQTNSGRVRDQPKLPVPEASLI